MATIFHYGPYSHLPSGPGLLPGNAETWQYGPIDWSGRVIHATARPRTQGVDGELSVTAEWMKYQAGQYFVITVENVGHTSIVSYEVWIGGTQS